MSRDVHIWSVICLHRCTGSAHIDRNYYHSI